jgi:hypothetical protein
MPNTFTVFRQIRRGESTFVFIEARSGNVDLDDNRDDADDHNQSTSPTERLHGSFDTPLYKVDNQFDQPLGNFHALGKSNGCAISFADGHALFYQYAFAGANNSINPDLPQIQAWSGGPVPPGIAP